MNALKSWILIGSLGYVYETTYSCLIFKGFSLLLLLFRVKIYLKDEWYMNTPIMKNSFTISLS